MDSHRRAVLVVVLCVVLLLMLSLLLLLSGTPKHFLSYSEDKYKISFASGNLTAVVTKDMPRVVFWHTYPVLSPEFEVSIQKLYVFNDTNGDGIFSKTEAKYTSYLDSHHVEWDFSKVEFANDSDSSEYAEVSMQGNASLYTGGDDSSVSPTISDWAVVKIQYRIDERPKDHTGVLGTYVVTGKTEMSILFTIVLLKHVEVDGIVVDLYLQGGGGTKTMLLKQKSNASGAGLTTIPSGLDESAAGAESPHRFMQADGPRQDVYIAKEDGTVQAFYHFSSAPMNSSGASASTARMNSSYYADGAGLVLDQAYFLANGTDVVSQESSLGIDESGFDMNVKGWLQDHLPVLMVVCGGTSAAILLTALVIMYRRYGADRTRDGQKSEERRKPS